MDSAKRRRLFVAAEKMVSFETSDLRKMGVAMTGFGAIFTIIGMLFFIDKGLIAIGNILIILGLTTIIGVKSTLLFFLKRRNFKGSISFGIGFFFVMIGWPFFGMLVETYGFVLLFRGFWPTLSIFMQRLPIVGWFFRQSLVIALLERGRPRRMPV